jgi:hypothetical protein
MRPKKRFIQSVISNAEQNAVEMPWARGTRRKAFIAKRVARSTEVRRSA